MKKLMLIAAAFATLVSCTKTQVIPTETAQQEISMKAYNQAAVKATGPVNGTDATLPTNEQMKVWAYFSNTESGTYTEYFSGVPFAYLTSTWKGAILDNSTSTYVSNPYYWPSSGYMKFIAVYPMNYPQLADATITYTHNTNTTEITKVNLSGWNNTAASNRQKDIMYSTATTECNGSGSTALTFKHLLSQVYVNFTQNTTADINLESVTISNVNTQGNIQVQETATTDITYNITKNDGEFLLLENHDLSTGYTQTTGMLVLPTNTNVGGSTTAESTNTGTPSITIVYTINNGPEISKTIESLGDWIPGNKYTYNFSIGLNEITFTAKAENWSNGTIPTGTESI